MNVHDLHSTPVTIIGAARSGVAAAELLASRGARVLVSDTQPKEQLHESINALATRRISVETGGHTERVYNCSLMVISPGVPSNAPVVLRALEKNIKVVSELEAASWFCPCPIVAVTGSNGKTTTTTLIGRILGDAKKKHVVAGNIGTAFSSVVLGLAETDLAVLEVSSFQLDHCETFRPNISVILNITEDHMDRYNHSMELYAASKARVFMNQRGTDVVVYSADDEWTVRTIRSAQCRTLPFSFHRSLDEGAFPEKGALVLSLAGKRTEVISLDEISIRGTHNAYNAMASALVGSMCGVSNASIRNTLRNFKGVEHRLEFVREVSGIRYVNDSKATNVDSVWYALQAFEQPLVVLIGGRDKGNDYSRLRDLVRTRVKAIVAIGESAEKVEQAFKEQTRVVKAESMEKAVKLASDLASRGDVVLLSPACASFDWFQNYEHRGLVFKELVRNLKEAV
jgi:UDP-N-acetylmuramoylalanine--D-glutamate ligase